MSYSRSRTRINQRREGNRRQYTGNTLYWWRTDTGTAYALPVHLATATIEWSPAGTAMSATQALRDRLSAGSRIASTLYEMDPFPFIGEGGIPPTTGKRSKLVKSCPCSHTAGRILGEGIVHTSPGLQQFRLVKTAAQLYRTEYRTTSDEIAYDGLSVPLHTSAPSQEDVDSAVANGVFSAGERVRDVQHLMKGANVTLALLELRDLPKTVVQVANIVAGLGDVFFAIQKGLSATQFREMLAVDKERLTRNPFIRGLMRARSMPRSFLKEIGRQSGSAHLAARFGLEPTIRDLQRLWIPFIKELNQTGKTDAIAKELLLPTGALRRAGFTNTIEPTVTPSTYTITNIGNVSQSITWSTYNMSSQPIGYACPWQGIPHFGYSSTLDAKWAETARAVEKIQISGVCYGQLIGLSDLSDSDKDFIRHTWRWGQLSDAAWNAYPFTWFVDWIVNLGALVSLMERSVRGANYEALFSEGIWETSLVKRQRWASVPSCAVTPWAANGSVRSTVSLTKFASWSQVREDKTFLRQPIRGDLTNVLLDGKVSPFRVGITTALLLSMLK